MKKKNLISVLIVVIICFSLLFSSCSFQKYIVDVSFRTTSEGTIATYTYSDGSTKTHIVKDGKDGADGQDVTAQSAYELWLEKNGKEDTAANYNAFLATLDLNLSTDNSESVQSTLNSVATLYCEYVYSETISSGLVGNKKQYGLAINCGSAFIYDIEENTDGYTYLVTNSHVVYCKDADKQANGNTYYPRSIHCFLYGSYDPKTAYGSTMQTDSQYGFNLYTYNSASVECELVGVCITADLAVVRAPTAELKHVNPDIKKVTPADEYYVGQEVFTVGNTDMEGLTATKGIISVDDEEITLDINGKNTYRALRFDAFIYEGNSGGALFNMRGQLVGVAFAGSPDFDMVNYAIPLDIYEGVVSNLIDNYDGKTVAKVKKPAKLGVSVLSENTRYVYDAQKGYGKIQEVVVVKKVDFPSIAWKMGLKENDQIIAVTTAIKNEQTNKTETVRTEITRSFKISDVLYRLRAGCTFSVEVLRDGETKNISYVFSASDLSEID